MSARPTPRVLSPTTLGPVALRNRIVKCATSEGLAREGLVTPRLIDFHREVAAGGAAMTTVAYLSVSPDGRTFRDQLYLQPRLLEGLAQLAEAVHAEGARVAVQLTHAGWFAKPEATGRRPRGPSFQFSPHAMRFARALPEGEIAQLVAAFRDAATACVDAGVDGVEVHVGHGYLLSQFLTPWNNRRRDRYGGDLEGRARFPREVVRAVGAAVGDRAAVWVKLNMEDGFAGGLTLDEALEVARWIEADGAAHALQLTAGHTTRTPFLTVRGTAPVAGMIENMPWGPTRVALRVAGKHLLRSTTYEEAYLLPTARRFRAALHMPLMLLGGIQEVATMERAIDEGFALIALGRALLRDPQLPERIRDGAPHGLRCTACNECVVEMERDGTRCVLR